MDDCLEGLWRIADNHPGTHRVREAATSYLVSVDHLVHLPGMKMLLSSTGHWPPSHPERR